MNIVPIIAKADTIAKSELKQFKDKVCKILCSCMDNMNYIAGQSKFHVEMNFI